jgi:NADH:ubiquinone oxidoreductase subunit F (NADH-binding)/NADPH-dependent glutamate synthase beta subunit-like oxidoreductase/(2Fe-2S) ferredoxin
MSDTKKINSIKELSLLKESAIKNMNTEKQEILICCGAGCIASGSLELKKSLETEIASAKLDLEVKETGCMGPCSQGPVIMIQPDGIVYESLKSEDASRIIQEHIINGQVIEDFAFQNKATGKKEAKIENVDFFNLQKKIVLRNCGKINPQAIEEYVAYNGYNALAEIVANMSGDNVIEEVKQSGLRGRGGAGFPTWMKWNFTKGVENSQKYVLCNADEGDPGAFMDRSVLEGDPHSIIEGMAIAAYAIGADKGYVYVRAEYPLAISRLATALDQAKEYGMLGKNILGSDFSFDLDIKMGSGAFVCGEETALIHSIEGKRGEPRPRPPFPAQNGLWGKPTLLNNVETYANIPAIFNNGARWYASVGTEESKGTKVFALAGAIEKSGLVEVPIGTALSEVIYDIGGGIKDGKNFKAAQMGGPSGGCIPKQHLNVALDYASLNELGAIMGSGGLIVMDESTCMVDVARFFLEFVQEESCGKCVPCRVGTKRMLEIIERITNGEGEEGDIEKLIDLGEEIKITSLCGLGQTAPNPVLSTIRHFRHEWEQHIRDKHCESGVCAGLVRAPCQSACPAAVDVPGFVSLVGEGRHGEALKLHRERNPFAAICARVCFHTCEDLCRRSSIDDAVSIRAIKRHMVDQEIVVQLPKVIENLDNEKKKIAIVGAGPSGLTCAYFLARLGYKPDVFESGPRPGGMMVQTIPAYRLPRETIAREIRMIENMGVNIITEQTMGKDFTIESLKTDGYSAIFVAVGASDSLQMGLAGEEAEGVVQAVPYLQQYNVRGSVKTGKQVIIIGGGNAAIDAARTSLRLGAEKVTIIYRRSRDEMPAYLEEVEEAVHEGVELLCLTQPIEIIKNDKNTVKAIKCSSMQLGEFDKSGRRRPEAANSETFTLNADQIIMAIGTKLDSGKVFGTTEIELNSKSFINVDPVSGQTSIEAVFAGGDAEIGPSSVVQAIAGGERAAVGIDIMLSGSDHSFWRDEKVLDTEFDPEADPVTYAREEVKAIPIEKRKHNFDEVEIAWCESVAQRQSKRCLRCDYGKPADVKEKTHA